MAAGSTKSTRPTRQWNPLPPRPETPDLLFTIPAELRNIIYEHVLREPYARHVPDKDYREPALLRVSKQVRSEALPLYFGINKFSVYLNISNERNTHRLAEWLQGLISACGSSRPFGAWKVRVWCGDYLAVLAMLPLFELFRSGQISHEGAASMPVHEAAEAKRSANMSAILPQPFFHRSTQVVMRLGGGQGNRNLQTSEKLAEFLDRLLVLADHARQEAWSQGEFEKSFKQAVAQKSAFGEAKGLNALVKRKAREKRGASRDW